MAVAAAVHAKCGPGDDGEQKTQRDGRTMDFSRHDDSVAMRCAEKRLAQERTALMRDARRFLHCDLRCGCISSRGGRTSSCSHGCNIRRNALKAAAVVGILLIVVGIIGFIAGSISFTHEKKDVDMGPVQIQHKQTKTVPISPILSALALVGGIGLVVVGARS
jgi:hypothetical protein